MLLGIIGVSVILGTVILLAFYLINEYGPIKAKRKERNRLKFISQFIHVNVNEEIDQRLFEPTKPHDLSLISNFGAFYGEMGPTFNENQLKVLTQYQLLILDGQNNG